MDKTKTEAFTMPEHVTHVISLLMEGLSGGSYFVEVTPPATGEYKRVKIDLTLKNEPETPAMEKKKAFMATRSVYVSMIEYDTAPGVSANKTTVLIFEQRKHDTFPITKTRHYVEPSFVGHEITAITHRSKADLIMDVTQFIADGINPP